MRAFLLITLIAAVVEYFLIFRGARPGSSRPPGPGGRAAPREGDR
jgi:hypothetical protein